MKAPILKILAAAAALVVLAGCIVESVYPFYTPKDLVFNQDIVGRWAKDGSTNEFWHFTVGGDKAYRLVTNDGTATNGFEAHLFQLKSYQFLDLRTTNRQDFQMPLHVIFKVNVSSTNLLLELMNYSWLADYLETNPAALRHVVVPNNPEDTNSGTMVYLTAETKNLQNFLLKHAEDTNAFSEASSVDLIRAAP